MNIYLKEYYWDEQWFLRIVLGVYSTQISKFSLNVWIVNEYSHFIQRGHGRELTYSRVIEPPYMAE
jgi:hypothetical protein